MKNAITVLAFEAAFTHVRGRERGLRTAHDARRRADRLGFIFLTVGARLIPAGEVFVDHTARDRPWPALGLFLGERPATLTLLGGSVVLAAVLLQTRAEPAAAVA